MTRHEYALGWGPALIPHGTRTPVWHLRLISHDGVLNTAPCSLAASPLLTSVLIARWVGGREGTLSERSRGCARAKARLQDELLGTQGTLRRLIGSAHASSSPSPPCFSSYKSVQARIPHTDQVTRSGASTQSCRLRPKSPRCCHEAKLEVHVPRSGVHGPERPAEMHAGERL